MIKKWQLIQTTDISPSHWFPLEKRRYQKPNGGFVDDFYVTPLANVALVIPLTKLRQVVLIKQYKPGIDKVIMQFPAGRKESKHPSIRHTAVAELEEETGIKVKPEVLVGLGKATGFSTKSSEIVFSYLVKDVSFNSTQQLDTDEEIEIILLSPSQVDKAIDDGSLWCAQSITAWYKAKHILNQNQRYNHGSIQKSS